MKEGDSAAGRRAPTKELLSPITQRRKCCPEPPASGLLYEPCIPLNCSDEHVLEMSAGRVSLHWGGALLLGQASFIPASFCLLC